MSRLVEILKTAKGPMRVDQIAAIVKQQGFTTDAKVGLNGTISGTLARGTKYFRRVETGTYEIIKKETTPTGAEPAGDS